MYTRKFDAVVKEKGAETVLLMVYSVEDTWVISRASMVGDCLGYVSIDRKCIIERDSNRFLVQMAQKE